MLSQVQRLLVYLSFQQRRFLPLLMIEEGPGVQDDVDDIDDFGDYDFNGDHYDYLNADDDDYDEMQGLPSTSTRAAPSLSQWIVHMIDSRHQHQRHIHVIACQ